MPRYGRRRKRTREDKDAAAAPAGAPWADTELQHWREPREWQNAAFTRYYKARAHAQPLSLTARDVDSWAATANGMCRRLPASPPARLPARACPSLCAQEQGIVPEGEWDEFERCLRAQLPVSFRLTGCARDPAVAALLRFMERTHVSRLNTEPRERALAPIPWYPDRLAWAFDVSRSELRGKGMFDPQRGARRVAAAASAGAGAGAADEVRDHTRNPLLHEFHQFLKREYDLGSISRQEEVSMIPPVVLGVEPGHQVLDMCAAPGSKTQQLVEALEGDRATDAPTGFVLANDSDFKRCHMLVHQCKRLNSQHIVFTTHDAQHLPSNLGPLRLQFDRVLADVPCSGDGTLRKAPDGWRKWAERAGNGMHRLQLLIAQRGAQLLKPGGRMVYSTCSLNPVENEAVVAALLSGSKGLLRLVDATPAVPGLRRAPVLMTWRVRVGGSWYNAWDDLPAAVRSGEHGRLAPTMFPPSAADAAGFGLDRCLRILPHHQNTGGFFVALLEKSENAPSAAPADALDEGEGVGVGTGVGLAGEGCGSNVGAVNHAQHMVASTLDAQPPATGQDPAPMIIHGQLSTNTMLDKLFELSSDVRDAIADFYGVDTSRLDLRQLVARSPKAKSVYIVSRPILDLLQADSSSKLQVVHTGIRAFEFSGAKDLECSYRLCQDGLPELLAKKLFSNQIVRAPISDVILGHQKRARIRIPEFTPETARQLRTLRGGGFAMVSEVGDRATAADGTADVRPHEVCLSAMVYKQGGTVDVLVPKPESNAFLIWIATLGLRATAQAQSEAATATSAAPAAAEC